MCECEAHAQYTLGELGRAPNAKKHTSPSARQIQVQSGHPETKNSPGLAAAASAAAAATAAALAASCSATSTCFSRCFWSASDASICVDQCEILSGRLHHATGKATRKLHNISPPCTGCRITHITPPISTHARTHTRARALTHLNDVCGCDQGVGFKFETLRYIRRFRARQTTPSFPPVLLATPSILLAAALFLAACVSV